MAQNPITGEGIDTYGKFKDEHFYLFGGINIKASAYVNSPIEFRDLVNLNFIYPGALTKRPGSTIYVGTTVSGNILGGTEFSRQNGMSMVVFAANTNLYTVNPPNVNAQVQNLMNGAIFNFVTFADRLLCANGNDFFKFDGTNRYNYSLPPGDSDNFGVTQVVGGSLAPAQGSAGSYVFVCSYAYINERGYVGPISNGITITINGATFNSIQYFGMTQPYSGYGITALVLFRTLAGGVNEFGSTFCVSNTTSATDLGFPLGNSLSIPHMWFTMAPRFQSIFNNQYFMSGFSSAPSRVYWSEIGEPEAVQPTYFADIRTNDGDRITGFKIFNNNLVIPKLRSFFQLAGTDPSNFTLQQISDEYGCLSGQAMVAFENFLWMLDQKGIVQFDGVTVDFISDKTEAYFFRMNVAAAIDRAIAVHYKQYNEVWFHFPIDGATLNNCTVVYDYVAKAWTRYEGIQASSMFSAQGNQSVRTVFYGGYTGALYVVGPSFMGDNGNAITCMAFSYFNAPKGRTTESMYRRFWGEVDPILGVTQPIYINLFTNYNASTIAYTGVIYQNTFQTRLDFGISARTIAAQLIHASATLSFKLNAYTFESRFQRGV